MQCEKNVPDASAAKLSSLPIRDGSVIGRWRFFCCCSFLSFLRLRRVMGEGPDRLLRRRSARLHSPLPRQAVGGRACLHDGARHFCRIQQRVLCFCVFVHRFAYSSLCSFFALLFLRFGRRSTGKFKQFRINCGSQDFVLPERFALTLLFGLDEAFLWRRELSNHRAIAPSTGSMGIGKPVSTHTEIIFLSFFALFRIECASDVAQRRKVRDLTSLNE